MGSRRTANAGGGSLPPLSQIPDPQVDPGTAPIGGRIHRIHHLRHGSRDPVRIQSGSTWDPVRDLDPEVDPEVDPR